MCLMVSGFDVNWDRAHKVSPDVNTKKYRRVPTPLGALPLSPTRGSAPLATLLGLHGVALSEADAHDLGRLLPPRRWFYL